MVSPEFYSPTLGRFLQRDPAGYVDGMNLYAYVRNNPLLFVDPSGLTAERTFFSDVQTSVSGLYKAWEPIAVDMCEKTFDYWYPKSQEAYANTIDFWHYSDDGINFVNNTVDQAISLSFDAKNFLTDSDDIYRGGFDIRNNALPGTLGGKAVVGVTKWGMKFGGDMAFTIDQNGDYALIGSIESGAGKGSTHGASIMGIVGSPQTITDNYSGPAYNFQGSYGKYIASFSVPIEDNNYNGIVPDKFFIEFGKSWQSKRLRGLNGKGDIGLTISDAKPVSVQGNIIDDFNYIFDYEPK